MRIVHVSDLHLTKPFEFGAFWGKRLLGSLSWFRKKQFEHKLTTLEMVFQQLLSENPDIVAITGDLVQLGLAKEIISAKNWLSDQVKDVEIIIVPGNHDIYASESLNNILTQWSKFLKLDEPYHDKFPSCALYGDLVLFGLCSALPTPFWSAQGFIDHEQFYRLELLMEKYSDKFKCVLLHHPPTSIAISKRKALINSEQLQNLFYKFSVELVIHGHSHKNGSYVLGDVTRVFSISSASKVSVDEAPSYRVFDITKADKNYNVKASLKSLNKSGDNMNVEELDEWQVFK